MWMTNLKDGVPQKLILMEIILPIKINMDIVAIIVQWLDKSEPENPEKHPVGKVSLNHFKNHSNSYTGIQISCIIEVIRRIM